LRQVKTLPIRKTYAASEVLTEVQSTARPSNKTEILHRPISPTIHPNLLSWQTSQNILTGSDTAASAVYDEIAGNWTNNNTVTTTTDNPVTNP